MPAEPPFQPDAVLKRDDYFDVGADMTAYRERSFQSEVDELFRVAVASHGPIRRLLDVGCASGRTSMFTKSLGVEELVGIEIDPRGVETAQPFMDRVLNADALTAELDYPAEHFDCMFFTDILEHVVDPLALLRRYLPFLRHGGSVIVSLPNFGHISIVYQILSATLRYQENGIMDSGHLRMFTQNTAVELLQNAGLRVARLVYRLDSEHWDRVKDKDVIPLPPLGSLHIDPKAVPPEVKKTYFVRKLNFLATLR